VIIKFVIIHNVPWFLPSWTGRACRLDGHGAGGAADSVLTPAAIASDYRAYTLAEISDFFGLRYSIVSRVVLAAEQLGRKKKTQSLTLAAHR